MMAVDPAGDAWNGPIDSTAFYTVKDGAAYFLIARKRGEGLHAKIIAERPMPVI